MHLKDIKIIKKKEETHVSDVTLGAELASERCPRQLSSQGYPVAEGIGIIFVFSASGSAAAFVRPHAKGIQRLDKSCVGYPRFAGGERGAESVPAAQRCDSVLSPRSQGTT